MRVRNLGWVVVAATVLTACDDPPVPKPQPTPPAASARPEYRFKFELKHKVKLVEDGVRSNDWVPAISPDGKYVAAAPPGRPAAVWDVETWEEVPIKAFHGKDHGSSFSLTAFSPSGRWLAFASRDNTIELIDWSSRRQMALNDDVVPRGRAYGGTVPMEMVFSSEENFLATGWFEGPIQILKLPELEQHMMLSEGAFSVPVLFSETSRTLVTMGRPQSDTPYLFPLRERGVRVYSTDSWTLERIKIDPELALYAVLPYDAESVLSTGADDESSPVTQITLWKWPSLEIVHRRSIDYVVGQPAAHRPTGYVAADFGPMGEGGIFELQGFAVFDPLGSAWQPVVKWETFEELAGDPALARGVGVMASRWAFSLDGKRCALAYRQWLLLFEISWEKSP